MKKYVFFALGTVLLAACVGAGAYYAGLQRQEATVQALQNKRLERENSYAKSLQTVQAQRSRALSDYQTACLEYQKLYASYEALYQKTGAASGLPRYLSPDAARGNEESCYR